MFCTARLASIFVFLGVFLATASSAAIPVTGWVTADGEPTAGARVTLVAETGRYDAGSSAAGEVRPHADASPEVVAEARSDNAGMFRLEGPAIGFYRVTVEVEGWVPMELVLRPLLHSLELPVVDLQANRGLEVRLHAGGEPVTARLLAFATDPARNRVLGHTVGLVRPGQWSPATFVGAADEEGVVRLPASGDKESWALEAVAPGFVALRAETSPGEPRLELAMDPGIERSVAIVDVRGRGVPEALVFVAGTRMPLGFSDAEGQLRCTVPEEEGLKLRALDRSGRQGLVVLEPGEPGAPPQELILEEVFSVSGRVVDEVTRQPIADPFVWGGLGSRERRQPGDWAERRAWQLYDSHPGGTGMGQIWSLLAGRRDRIRYRRRRCNAERNDRPDDRSGAVRRSLRPGA